MIDTGIVGDLIDKDTDNLYTEENWDDMIRNYHAEYFGSNIGFNQITRRIAQIRAVVENLPEEVLDAATQFPGDLKDGQIVSVIKNESDESAQYGRVSIDAQGAMTVYELWLDAMGVPHETGKELPWLASEVVPVAIWHA